MMIKRLFLLVLILMAASLGLSQRVDYDKRLSELGITLSPPGKPIANYVKAVRTGNLVFLAGHGPLKTDGAYVVGKVGKDLTVDQGYEAARLTAIAALSTLKYELGDLNKVKRIVKVLGMVNCTADFTEQPKVINGFSDTMVSVFGENGKHARSAIGVNALPLNTAVEVEMIVEVE
jgi:enamine deaminase RidA (YjgF/YER057c/UK114 family)